MCFSTWNFSGLPEKSQPRRRHQRPLHRKHRRLRLYSREFKNSNKNGTNAEAAPRAQVETQPADEPTPKAAPKRHAQEARNPTMCGCVRAGRYSKKRPADAKNGTYPGEAGSNTRHKCRSRRTSPLHIGHGRQIRSPYLTPPEATSHEELKRSRCTPSKYSLTRGGSGAAAILKGKLAP